MTPDRRALVPHAVLLFILHLQDVEFELTADNNTFIGETLQVSLRVKNLRSKKTRTVNGQIIVKTKSYTGVPYKEVVKGRLPRTAISGKDGT